MNTITQGLSPKLLALPALEPIRTMPTWSGKAYDGMYRARPDQASTWAFPKSFEPMSANELIG
ncbi:MAG: hypothetical protein ACKVQT_19360 [Burkholderiales bacterium]